MVGVFGLSFVLFGILMMAATRVVLENPHPPAWARWSPLRGTVAILFMFMMIVGVALIFDFAFTFSEVRFGVVETLATVAVVVVAAVAWRALRPGQRLAAYKAAKGGAT